MAKIDNWSREQLLVAFSLYCRLPFGQFDQRNRDVIQAATVLNRSPSAVAMKLGNIASLDAEIRASNRSGLTKASNADRAMWQEMQQDWGMFALAMGDALPKFGLQPPAITMTDVEAAEDAAIDHSSVNRLALTKVRVGQAFFRSAVLSAYNGRCCITGVAIPRLLVASHIVPWQRNPSNRLNPANGLCLNALHDKAFDAGLLTIDADLRVCISKRIKSAVESKFQTEFLAFHGAAINEPLKFRPMAAFLAYHREHVFEQGNADDFLPIAI